MGTLFIDRKGIALRHEGLRVVVCENGRASGSVPVSHIDRVVIHRQALVDTGVLGILAEHGVGLVVLNPRKPERTASLMGRAHNDVTRRLAQYRHSLDEVWCGRWAVALVARKIRSQLRLLECLLEARPDQRRALTAAVRGVSARLHGLRDGQEPGRDRVRGIEGAAAAAYFGGFCAVFPPAVEFTGRNRRPPRDPVNACLSLAYTLAHSEAVMVAHAVGLDPLLGFYHDPAFGRESLASDLIEPLRPLADAWVWGLFRERSLRSENFSTDKGACLLNKAGRRTFYKEYEVLAPGIRRRLRRYCGLLVRSLTAGEKAGADREARRVMEHLGDEGAVS